EEDHLVLELDAVLLPGAAPCLGHQRDRVLGARAAGVLDEVRVSRRDLSAADPVALQAAGLEHPSCRELVLRILEDAAVGPLVGWLCRLPLSLKLGHDRLDLFGRTRREAELDPRHDLSGPKLGVAVAEAQLTG